MFCGFKTGKSKLDGQCSFKSFQNLLANLHSTKVWFVVSSCNLQKEHSLVSILLNIKSCFLRYQILFSILYWNICILVSIETLPAKR